MDKTFVMKNEKVSSALIKLGLPAVVGMLINAIYNVADTYFVSGISTEAIGGAAVAYPLTMVVVGVGGIFGHGAASYISRLFGQGRSSDADNTAFTSCICSFVLSLIMMAVVLPYLTPILKILGATDTMMQFAKDYSFIYMLGSPFAVMSINLNNIARSEGAAKTSMIALSSGAIINIILDPLFIYTFDMGIKGAAIATVIAQIFTTLFLVYYFNSKKSYLKISIIGNKFSKVAISEMLKIGIPTFVFQLLTSFAIGFTNVQAAEFGDEAVASVGIITKLLSIGLYVVFGYTKGFQPFVGYNYGANSIQRVKKAIKFSLILTTIFCALIATVFIIFSSTIIGWFSKSEVIINIGSRGLIASSIFFITFGFQMVYATLFLALGKGKEGSILCILRQGICLIPILLIMPQIIGLDGVLFAQGIADLLAALVTAVFAVKFYQQLNQGDEEIEDVAML